MELAQAKANRLILLLLAFALNGGVYSCAKASDEFGLPGTTPSIQTSTPSSAVQTAAMQTPHTGWRREGFAELDQAPSISNGWNGNGVPVEGWEATEPPGYVPDPLLEKQLRYSPPQDEIEGILLESSDPTQEELLQFSSERYINYRSRESALSYLPGGASQFGWLSMESQPYIARGYGSGLTSAIDIHWLSGPSTIDLPAHLYDFILGYQIRAPLSKRISVDLAANLGVYSDFEGSARDGVRYPGHAVGMYRWNRNTDLVLGVDYLSRDDIKILPVFGFSWRNPYRPAWRFDLVFPRPRIDYMLTANRQLYLAGLLGGGTWDIELPNGSGDVMTYRDYRLMFGYEQVSKGSRSAIEMGYVFDRHLEFRERLIEADFDDAFVIRFVKRN